jgi:hypothetical protein
MRILLVTYHPPEKSFEPLKYIKADFQTITLKPRRPRIVNLVGEIVDILAKAKTHTPDVIVCHGGGWVGFYRFNIGKGNC